MTDGDSRSPSCAALQNGTDTSSARPYTASMPPNPHNQVQGDFGERHHREPLASIPRRSRNGIVGNYTLGKTLRGGGNVGKVKLATHNITGEKVCLFQSSAR